MSKTTYDYGYNIKSVRLCDESKAIADDLNFSRWAREQLIAWDRQQKEVHVQAVGQGFHRLCNPFHRHGACEKCWPVGIPTQDNWKAYLKASREGLEPDAPVVQTIEERTSPYESQKATILGKQSGTQETNQNTGKEYFAGLGWIVALIVLLL